MERAELRKNGDQAPVAQWIEQPVSTRSVGGSSPSGRTPVNVSLRLLRRLLAHPSDELTPSDGATVSFNGWYRRTMLATIDAGGRVVVPKDVRERLGLRPGMQVQLTEVDGALEITPMVTPMSVVERSGVIVLESERTMPTLTADQVRDVQEATRR